MSNAYAWLTSTLEGFNVSWQNRFGWDSSSFLGLGRQAGGIPLENARITIQETMHDAEPRKLFFSLREKKTITFVFAFLRGKISHKVRGYLHTLF